MGATRLPPPLRHGKYSPLSASNRGSKSKAPEVGDQTKRRTGSKLRCSLKSLTPALPASRGRQLGMETSRERVFLQNLQRALLRANSWKCRESRHSWRSDFLQHFGTSGSAPWQAMRSRRGNKTWYAPRTALGQGSFPEKGYLTPGQRLDHVLGLLSGERTQGLSPEGCSEPTLAFPGTGAREASPLLGQSTHTGFLDCPGHDQI